MDQFSYIANADTAVIDQLYQAYQQDPSSVDVSWQNFFKGYDFSLTWAENGHKKNDTNGNTEAADLVDVEHSVKEVSVASLIKAYRSRGHLLADTNPIRTRKDRNPRLTLKDYGLAETDLDTVFESANLLGIGPTTLRGIMKALEKIYAGHIGFEYMYIREIEVKNWLRNKIEKEALVFDPTTEEKTRILEKLNEAVVLESFLHTKFLGQKRFSLEGGEATIPALDTIVNTAAELGTEQVMIGMAHRGRLNVLANIMHKSYEELFSGFEGIVPDDLQGDGDVKYHLGYSSEHITPTGKQISLKLAPNPSHLEAVNPVVEGFVRASADAHYNSDYDKMLPILIHGDAALAGQGIVYEVTQMAKLKGYSTGGTVHFVINNQVGFTTDFDDARSSIYCSDVAKIIDAPIFHVNGDDPEAVVFCAKMAVEFREKFNRDVFIDMVCYRRWGHNEADEPKFTQPTMYNIIQGHDNIWELYKKELVSKGEVGIKLAEKMDADFKAMLQARLDKVKQKEVPTYKPLKLDMAWKQLRFSEPEDFDQSPDTSISADLVDKIATALVKIPAGFKPIKQIDNLLKSRQQMFFETKQLNWAAAELLAYGSIVANGKIVRLSGQDVQRGTFSHRHAVLHDSETNETYNSLNFIEEGQEKLHIHNSLLSEYGVLGFEYGYSMANPNALVIWEAQFGDFANGAQIMIDQFVAAGESKWGIQNGLVMLLPHGYEGQGPEHSNARPERFLQLTGEYNMIVANLTTPANLFHLMRRQMAWSFRKPCIVMSPKSMLRNPLCVSPMSEITNSSFKEIYGDTFVNPKKVKRVLMCSGKIYYDLLDAQQKGKRDDVAILRIEQLHPLPLKQIEAELAKYPKAKLYWVQEEPQNMGYWTYMLREFGQGKMELIARKLSASPSTGFLKIHTQEQANLIAQAFA